MIQKLSSGNELLGGFFLLTGVLLLLGSGGFLIFQSVLWLRDGFWTAYEVRYFWGGDLFQFEWAGVGHVVAWFCTQPLTAGVAMAAVLLIAIGMVILTSRDGPH